jgi:hypothetical protein
MDRSDGAGLHPLLAHRPRPPRLHDLEQTHVQRKLRQEPPHDPPQVPHLGQHAFDAYKADTLRRLEEEQDAFEAFLQRLRDAKDKSEFDQFMDERRRPSAPKADETTEA